jgi:hypothetical protein
MKLKTCIFRKRQYIRRLKYWGLQKNIKAHEKDALIAKIVDTQTKGHTIIDVRFNGRPVSIGVLHRYCQDATRSRQKCLQTGSHSTISPAPITTSFDLDGVVRNSIEIVCGDGNVTSTALVMEALEDFIPTQNEGIEATLLPSTLSSDPQPPFGQSTTLEAILFLTRTYLHGCLEFSQIPDSRNGPQSWSATDFWSGVRNAIYFLKIGWPELAWPVLSNACDNILAKMPVSIDMLRELLSTLAPSNTSICPPIRQQLLAYLASMLKLRVGDGHPLAAICQHLQTEVQGMDISESALRSSLEILENALGQEDGNVFNIRNALIVLLRRGGNLQASEWMCRTQIKNSERVYGMSSSYTRTAMSELVHNYTARKSYEQARAVCEDILQRGRYEYGIGDPDESAVWAMEDFAEILELQNDRMQSLKVLHEAQAGAFHLWGVEAASSVCISRKIETLLKL